MQASTRDRFLRRFGTDTAEKICSLVLDNSDVDSFSSFTEDDFGRVMSGFQTTLIHLTFAVAFDPASGFLSVGIGEWDFVYEKIREVKI